MATFHLFEASPLLIETGAGVAIRLAGGGRYAYNQRGFTDWRSGLVDGPSYSASFGFSDEGWTGGAIPSSANISFFPADAELVASLLNDYLWTGAAVEMRSGDDELAPGVYTLELVGTIAAVKAADGIVTFTIADLARKLDEPLIKATFKGTGGIEGLVEADGRTKRRSFGLVRNVEGFLLDKPANVYEFGDPSFPLDSFVTLSDKGRAGSMTVLAWQGSIAATLTALKAATPPAGGGTVAPSIACVKWWTQPVGPLTADLKGEVGAGYVDKAADLATRIVTAVSGPAFESGVVASINAIRTAAHGIHVDSINETVASILDRLLLPSNILWAVNSDGSIRLSPVQLATSTETILAISAERVETLKPARSIKLGYKRNNRKHSDAEISAALLVADIDNAGDLASLDHVQFSGPTIKEADGTTTATQANFKTSLGTAGAIAGQAATATNSDFSAVSGSTKPENNADVTTTVTGPGAGNILYDYTGATIEAGQPPLSYALSSSAGFLVSGTITASYIVVDGNVNGKTTTDSATAITVTSGVAELPITALATDSATIQVTMIRNGVSKSPFQTILTKQKALQPPPSAGGGGYASSQTSGFVGIGSNTSMVNILSDRLALQMPTGKTTCRIVVALSPKWSNKSDPSAGPWDIEYRVQRNTGTTGSPIWTDIGALQNSSPDPYLDDLTEPVRRVSVPGTMNYTLDDTGRTAGTTYEYRVVGRIASGSTSGNGGGIIETGSVTLSAP